MSDRQTAQVTIWCNHPGCYTEFMLDVPANEPDGVSFEKAGHAAEALGWQVDHRRHDAESLDYCPQHHVHEDVRTDA